MNGETIISFWYNYGSESFILHLIRLFLEDICRRLITFIIKLAFYVIDGSLQPGNCCLFSWCIEAQTDQCFVKALACLLCNNVLRDRNRWPEGGEWEPIKISSEIDPSAYIPEITASPQPKVWENSYGLAISQQHTLENFAEAKEPTRCESQNTAEGTGQTAHWDRSDRSGWSRRPRPVRPVSQTGQTGRSQTARNQSSKWQISSKRSPNPTKLGG